MEKHPDIKVVFPYESVLSGTNFNFGLDHTEAAEIPDRIRQQIRKRRCTYIQCGSRIRRISDTDQCDSQCKSLEGEDVRNALMELSDLKCSTGAFSFDSNGNVVRSVTLSTLKDGKPVNEYICEVKAKSKALEDEERRKNRRAKGEE